MHCCRPAGNPCIYEQEQAECQLLCATSVSCYALLPFAVNIVFAPKSDPTKTGLARPAPMTGHHYTVAVGLNHIGCQQYPYAPSLYAISTSHHYRSIRLSTKQLFFLDIIIDQHLGRSYNRTQSFNTIHKACCNFLDIISIHNNFAVLHLPTRTEYLETHAHMLLTYHSLVREGHSVHSSAMQLDHTDLGQCPAYGIRMLSLGH